MYAIKIRGLYSSFVRFEHEIVIWNWKLESSMITNFRLISHSKIFHHTVDIFWFLIAWITQQEVLTVQRVLIKEKRLWILVMIEILCKRLLKPYSQRFTKIFVHSLDFPYSFNKNSSINDTQYQIETIKIQSNGHKFNVNGTSMDFENITDTKEKFYILRQAHSI